MAVLYEKGIVVIPKKIRLSAGLRSGARLNIRSEGRRVIIESEDDALESFRQLCSNANLTGKEVAKEIKEAEKRMEAEIADVH